MENNTKKMNGFLITGIIFLVLSLLFFGMLLAAKIYAEFAEPDLNNLFLLYPIIYGLLFGSITGCVGVPLFILGIVLRYKRKTKK